MCFVFVMRDLHWRVAQQTQIYHACMCGKTRLEPYQQTFLAAGQNLLRSQNECIRGITYIYIWIGELVWATETAIIMIITMVLTLRWAWSLIPPVFRWHYVAVAHDNWNVAQWLSLSEPLPIASIDSGRRLETSYCRAIKRICCLIENWNGMFLQRKWLAIALSQIIDPTSSSS